LLARRAGILATPRLRDACLAAAVLPSIAMLTLLAARTALALAAEHRGKPGDTLPVEASQPGLAVAGGLTLLAAAVAAAVAMLTLLAERTAVRFAAEYWCDTGDAAPVVAHQAG
jgi:hypothetical protein